MGGSSPEPTLLSPHDRRQERPVWPEPRAQADASEEIVVLESPGARSSARRVIRGFFEAVRRESVQELGSFVTDDATISSGPGSAPEPVSKVWAARFRRLDYGFNGAKQAYREDELGFFTATDISRLVGVRRFELEPEPGELLVVVTTRDRRKLTGPRHFGRRIEFVLGSIDDGLRITRMFEDFRLP